jgi:glucose-1-phosphate thymidylyltransferase
MRTEPVEVWLDAGKPETTLETNAWLLENGRANHLRASDVDGVRIVPPVFLPASCRVEESILGPNVSLGENVEVRGSYIRNAIIEDGAQIEGAELHDSLVGRRASLKGVKGIVQVGDEARIDAGGPGEGAGA